MIGFKKRFLVFASIFSLTLFSICSADSHNIYEIIDLIQKDLKTLERAVYSDLSSESNQSVTNETTLDQNSEDVLTRHLLKLSEIGKQFQDLTNRFEEINFKIDKLSSRISKVQADNQLRFQQIEKTVANTISSERLQGYE